MENRFSNFVAPLACISSLCAAWAWWSGWASGLEAFGFSTGAICVWLVVRQSSWNFPIGLLNVSAYFFVFFHSQLYADAFLQVIYFLLGVIGWWMWSKGGVNHSLPVTRASVSELAWVLSLSLVATVFIARFLYGWTGTTAIWDALTTSISLGSQWLLNRKKLENWMGWILVDTIYVPLYMYKGLYLTSFLYSIFLVMAILGYLNWRAELKSKSIPTNG